MLPPLTILNATYRHLRSFSNGLLRGAKPLQTRRGTDWQPYEPMFAVYTDDGERVQEPVMRRQIAQGRWEYRRMTPMEARDYSRSHSGDGAASPKRLQ
jgi:hypothetical protein